MTEFLSRAEGSFGLQGKLESLHIYVYLCNITNIQSILTVIRSPLSALHYGSGSRCAGKQRTANESRV